MFIAIRNFKLITWEVVEVANYLWLFLYISY